LAGPEELLFAPRRPGQFASECNFQSGGHTNRADGEGIAGGASGLSVRFDNKHQLIEEYVRPRERLIVLVA